MSVIERFLEIPIVGALLLLPLIPWLYIQHTGTPEVLATILQWSRSRRAALGLAVVFVLGVAGNQLVDVVTGISIIDPKTKHENQYRPAQGAPNTLEGAEHVIGTRSDYSRTYFERHRMFMRIDRAAAVGALLLILSMLVFRLHSKTRVPPLLYAGVVVAALAFGTAYYTEANSFWKKVVLLEQSGLAQPLPQRP